MKRIVEKLDEAARTLDVRDYQIVLDEIAGEISMHIFRTSLAEPPCEGAESQDGGADWLIEIETLGELVARWLT